MLKVLITVDTEYSFPLAPDWKSQKLADDAARDIHGRTRKRCFGIGHQMELLDRHGLKGVFFVEALSGLAAGPEPVREVVQTVIGHGHEVQLHIHTEWLPLIDPPLFPGRGRYMTDFSLSEQETIIAAAVELLQNAGAPRPTAFRAGNYGANRDTLKALVAHGIRFDTSYNLPYLRGACRLESLGTLLQPMPVDGLVEFPVTFFRDGLGKPRPFQLCCCSTAEMEHLLMEASNRGWHSVVLVLHSFEMVRRFDDPGTPPVPRRFVAKRFGRLCRFLDRHRDRFETCGFASLDPSSIPVLRSTRPIEGRPSQTVWRYVEQFAGIKL